MKRFIKVAAVGLSLLLVGTIVTAKGMRGLNKNNRGRANLAAIATNLPVQELSAEEAAGLTQMREEEKLARDVYQAMFEKWELAVFSNIARSEQRHMNAIKALLDKYGMADPVTDSAAGIFTNPEMLTLYTDLVEKGKTSLVDALQVGATIEDLDIKDLYDFLEQTDNTDIKTVYQNLAKGSRNHLRTFTYQLALNGAAYEAQYLTADKIDDIINSPRERGRVDENGHQVTGPGRISKGKGMYKAMIAKNGFVDADGDGVCDNWGNRMMKNGNGRGRGFGANQRGRGLHRGNRDGSGPMNRTGAKGPNYVDANNDGICDHLGARIPVQSTPAN
jgi:hypothetical protein